MYYIKLCTVLYSKAVRLPIMKFSHTLYSEAVVTIPKLQPAFSSTSLLETIQSFLFRYHDAAHYYKFLSMCVCVDVCAYITKEEGKINIK